MQMREGPRSVERQTERVHPVLVAFKAREHLQGLSRQVRDVIPPETPVSTEEGQKAALEKLFGFYARRAPEWQRMLGEERIPPEERERNIHAVNEMQEAFLRGKHDKKGKPLFPSDERFSGPDAKAHRALDLYARLDPGVRMGDMDEFQLAIIARAARWYIEEGHSKLFDRIRIVPGNRVRDLMNRNVAPEMFSASARIALPDAEELNVAGDAFKDSMTFANRFGLTVWNAKEASDRGTIPLITWTTLQDPAKFHPKDVVVFRAVFNADDRGRVAFFPTAFARAAAVLKTRGKVSYKETNVAGDIAGLINETIRCLRELEEKEIARVRGAR